MLLNQVAIEDEDDSGADAERVRSDFCLGVATEYLACPVFRRLAIERSKAF